MPPIRTSTVPAVASSMPPRSMRSTCRAARCCRRVVGARGGRAGLRHRIGFRRLDGRRSLVGRLGGRRCLARLLDRDERRIRLGIGRHHPHQLGRRGLAGRPLSRALRRNGRVVGHRIEPRAFAAGGRTTAQPTPTADDVHAEVARRAGGMPGQVRLSCRPTGSGRVADTGSRVPEPRPGMCMSRPQGGRPGCAS